MPNETSAAKLRYRRLLPGEKFIFSGMADSSWRDCKETGRTTGGHLVLMNQQAIGWSSKLMLDSVKLGTTEAESCQLSACARDVFFPYKIVSQFLAQHDDRFVMSEEPVVLEEDNKGAVDISPGDGNTKGLQHLDHHHFFVREAVDNKAAIVKKIPKDDNTADLLTKPADSRARLVRLFQKVSFFLEQSHAPLSSG